MSTRMVSMSDFRDEHGKLDWDAYKRAEIENGERCTKCGAFIHPPRGYRATCHACTAFERDGGEVSHSSKVRCPKCGYSWNPFDCDNYEVYADGEHEVGCHSCDHYFTITTYVSYTLKSPARLPEEIEPDDEADEDDED